MKVKFRRSTNDDLEAIYNLHTKCFSKPDQWYKSAIKNYLNKGILIETTDKNNLSLIIGVLLQGSITPCNQKIDIEAQSLEDASTTDKLIDSNYKEDIFEPLTENGHLFLKNNIHLKPLDGIVMICIDPKFRGKGLGKKLIEKHWIDYPNLVVCLHTRKSNIGAFMLYKSMGYEPIAYVKNKYFLPTEDSVFMIKDLTEINELPIQ